MTSDADEREERRVREAIADRLGRAFASVPKPSPPVTRGGPLADDIEKVLADKDAGALTAGDARDVRGDLSLLTGPALRYYLPALLRLVLVSDTWIDGLDDFTYQLLVPPEEPGQLRRFEEQFGNLDASQRTAIDDYVAWYSEGESSLPGRQRACAHWQR